jgi:2,3-bisphosphoglycerate-dependent phosphoglycerate mutase
VSANGGIPQKQFELPPGATEVILVRHGASANAMPGVMFPLIDGRSDPALSEAGEDQARSVGEHLADEPLAGIFVTPLTRTQQTAAPLAQSHRLDPVVVEDLAEVRLGDWEGGEYRIRVANRDPIIRRVFDEERWDIIPGAESPESLTERVRRGILHVIEAVGPDAVAAVVAHGGVIGEACRIATGSRPFAFVHSDNGSVSRLVVRPSGKWQLRSFNEIAHLRVRTGPAG